MVSKAIQFFIAFASATPLLTTPAFYHPLAYSQGINLPFRSLAATPEHDLYISGGPPKTRLQVLTSIASATAATITSPPTRSTSSAQILPMARCNATYTPTSGETCGEVALKHDVLIDHTYAALSVSSLTCNTVLRTHGVCLDGSRQDQRTSLASPVWREKLRPTGYSTVDGLPPFRNGSMSRSSATIASTGMPRPSLLQPSRRTHSTTNVSFPATTPRPTKLRTDSGSSVVLASTEVKSTMNDNDVYRSYNGDGSPKAGWPSIHEWQLFDEIWNGNLANMEISCDQWQVPRNSPAELAELRKAIIRVSKTAALDPRFVLAIVIQESQGCVRVPTTFGSHANPGLMQSYSGNGSCNSGNGVETPCPYSEIRLMIKDGALGTSSGPGLSQGHADPNYHGAKAFYRAARIYNSGSIPPNNDLSGPTSATVSYASDIANRLRGWVYAPKAFNG